jgi:predicted nucleotidyltransferase
MPIFNSQVRTNVREEEPLKSFLLPTGRENGHYKKSIKKEGYIIFRRTTKKPTGNLILITKHIHDMIHEGKIDNDYKQIKEVYPYWRHISAIIKTLGLFG